MSLITMGYGHLTIITMGLGNSIWIMQPQVFRPRKRITFVDKPSAVSVEETTAPVTFSETDVSFDNQDIEIKDR